MRTRWVGGARGGAVRIDLDCRELLLQLGEVELFREDRGRHRRPTSPQGMEVLQISCRRLRDTSVSEPTLHRSTKLGASSPSVLATHPSLWLTLA